MAEFGPVVMGTDEGDWQTAMRWAATFLAGFQSARTRKSYRRDLHCWFAFCAAHGAHPYPRSAPHAPGVASSWPTATVRRPSAIEVDP